MRKILVFACCWLSVLYTIGQEKKEHDKTVGVTISLPYFNNYCYYDYDRAHTTGKSGFMGFGLAIYYKQDKNKFSLNTGLTGDLPAPMGPICYANEGTRSMVTSLFADLLY